MLGVMIFGWLLPGPKEVRGVTFDYGTMLFGATAILIGFQAVNFAAFSKIFATSEGLLPENPLLTRMYRYVTLEVGLVIGALLIGIGAAMWVLGLNYWKSHSFGPLDPDEALRIIISGLVSLTLGFQIVLSSFFISVLGMRRR